MMTGETNNLSAVYERGRLSRRLAISALILSGCLSLVVFLAGPVYQWSGMPLFTLGLMPFVLALIFSLAAFWHALFFSRMVTEEEEKKLLEKRKSSVTSLLDISEDVRFTAKHTLAMYEKYVPSSVALLCFLLCGAGIAAFWTNTLLGGAATEAMGSTVPKNPINLAFLCALSAAFSFIGGIFYVGQSHVREFRWLRPVGSMLILGAAVMLLSAVCALLLNNGYTGYDTFIEKIVFLIYAIIAVEFLFNFIIEFYRPRTKGEQRPVFESRVLSVFTEPGGVMRNVAESLDYQFGFKVSKTWIYVFFQKHLIPALILWAAFFWIFTCIAEVAPGEVGIRERFGAFPGSGTEILEPGVHLKLPWPCEKIIRVPVDIVQTVTIGAEIDKKAAEAAKVVLWTGTHYLKEDMFLVAMEQNRGKAQGQDNLVPPASLLEAALPVYYKAKKNESYQYAFHFLDMAKAMTAIGDAEATQYFASTDFMKDISFGRKEVCRELRDRIQRRCDLLHMGVDVLSVGMHDAHPPVGPAQGEEESPEAGEAMPNVAESFQDVICAKEEALSSLYLAESKQVEIVEGAKSDALKIRLGAEAYRFNVTEVAKTDAFRFESQIKSFRSQPEMFGLRSYLDFLENDCAAIRKFVVSSKIPMRNYIMNLEAKPSLDLLDTDLSILGK